MFLLSASRQPEFWYCTPANEPAKFNGSDQWPALGCRLHFWHKTSTREFRDFVTIKMTQMYQKNVGLICFCLNTQKLSVILLLLMHNFDSEILIIIKSMGNMDKVHGGAKSWRRAEHHSPI